MSQEEVNRKLSCILSTDVVERNKPIIMAIHEPYIAVNAKNVFCMKDGK